MRPLSHVTRTRATETCHSERSGGQLFSCVPLLRDVPSRSEESAFEFVPPRPMRQAGRALASPEKFGLRWQQRDGSKEMAANKVAATKTLKLKRVYEPPAASDGYRILVDRLWPRGLSKEKAHVDLWMKDIGPSNALRKWFGHDPNRWDKFQERYRRELETQPDLVNELKSVLKKHRTATLLFGAKDEQHNQAVVLREFVQGRRAAKASER